MLQTACLFALASLFVCAWSIDSRPMIIAQSGSLEIAAAPGGDIKLQVTSGGKLFLQDVDISAMINDMTLSLGTLQQCSADSKSALAKISSIEGDINSNSILARLSYLERYTNNTNRLVFLISRPLRRRINNLQKRLSSLTQSLNMNECNSNPCKHGGTCQDLYNAYNCLCPPSWEGSNCEQDVNECDNFRGTELGCQNGAQCINTPGSYECKCAEGWFGFHCIQHTQDCNNSQEVCGHGTCIPLRNGYKCLCDQGWKTDGVRQACTVDVNECETYHPPCSSNPPVQCVNLPGTFYCGHCPAGYTGNGYYCSDINECEILNGGCSMYPMVQCVNVPGSRICGRCPPGYNGDGVTCSFQGVCGVGNGGCHPLAQCRDNPRISSTYVECICPHGYSGDGFGPNGCNQGGVQDPCISNPCMHGTCIASTIGYTCNCTRKYTGRNCDIRKDGCLSNPCQNGGTCQPFLFSFICSCPAGFSGPTCQNNVLQCGQMLGPRGQLTYPPAEFQFNRNSQISCAVRIKATTSKVLNVTVHGVYLPVCTHNYFQIHDGRDTGSPLIGRFCDEKLKNGSTIISTTDSLYLWLKGDALAPKPFVNISWTSIKPVCGSYINVTESGTFRSPGSPQNYPPNRDCYWKLNAPLNKRIKFTFYHLEIGNNTDCSKDYLAFNEGLEPSDKHFFQRCRTGIIEPTLSPANEVTVHLHTIGSYSGFLIHYSLIEGGIGCGGIYTHSSGIISSPTNRVDSDDITCEYKIQLGFKTHMKIHFRSFKAGGILTNCNSDGFRLAIYEGATMDAPLIGRFCGPLKPPDLSIVDSQALIIYKHMANAGFELEYKTTCGGTYTDESGVIQSDNYPTPITIDEPIECNYVIMRPPQNRIQIEFNGLDIGNGSNWDCKIGFLDIAEGKQENSANIRHYCSMKPDEILYVNNNFASIHYTAKYGTVGGFSLSYKSLADSTCGGVLTEMFGSVETPRDLHTYENGLNCTWLLSAPPGYMIQINWLTFNMEESYQCVYDSVRVFDNVTEDGTEMGKFCGNRLPPAMTTTSNMATIFFKIDALNNFDGFYLTYRFISVSNICGGHYFSPSGIIKSPTYPLPYPNNRNCMWIITVPDGQQIQLNITSFDLEVSANCRYDYLQILNGGTLTSPLVGKYCGRTIPKRIYSHTNQLYLQFVSDKTKTGPGFELQWTTAATGCGGTLSSPSGTIISPNYPEPYGRNAECFWKIAVSAGSKVQAVFADLDLEYLHGCFMDYVDFYDGPDTMSKKLGTFCKMEGHSPVILSSSNHLALKFRSDINYQGRGFQLQYSTMCRTNLTGFGGTIENPNFPNNSPVQQDCEWQINVPDGNHINLTFSHFAFVSPTMNCDLNNLEIAYEHNYERQTLGKFCDANPPDEELNIKANNVVVKFHYGSRYIKSQFRLEWMLSGCGGLITRPEGVLQTPDYPNNYPISTTCNWHLQTAFGKSIEMVFDVIDMEVHANCELDYISVHNGPDESYPQVAKFCHSIDRPTVVTGTGREMYVSFVSDISYTGKGFHATYRTVASKCGGLLTAASGVLHSPNYPNNYDRNDTCEWLISVPENHLIDLVFEIVDLLNVCEMTYIKVYDGPTPAYPLLAHICGTKTPEEKFTSRTNHLYIVLTTHSLLTTKGFLARYTTACGARIQTQGGGLITYRSDALSNTNITNCTWTIIAENPTEHILLTFSRFVNSQCFFGESHTLTIYDGESSNASTLGTYCSKMPGVLRSSGNMMHLELPDSYHQMQFTARYSVVESGCGGTLLAETGEISSPNYPDSYPVDIQCEWTLNVGESIEIRLDFTTLDIAKSDNCNEDYLELREGSRSGRLIGTFCGNVIPSNISAMSALWMYFKSERPSAGAEITTGKGFLADFELSTLVELSGTNGTIVSPFYPERFETEKTYKWQITIDVGKNIYFEFDEMAFPMANNDYCYAASLTIIDGKSEDDEALGQFCRPSQPIKSTSNVATLLLQGAIGNGGVKFKLRWKQTHATNTTQLGCDSSNEVLLENSNYTLSNKVLPGLLSRRMCTWTFTTVAGRHLRARFVEIISSSAYCVIDSISLFDGSGYGIGEVITAPFKLLALVCNSSFENALYNTTGNSLKIQHSVLLFSQARNRTASMFILDIVDACGGSITKSNSIIIVNGTIEPQSGKQLECKWKITVPTGKRISLEMFTNFTNDASCDSKVVVHNGHNVDAPVVLSHCGTPPKASTITTGNKAFVAFKGNYSSWLKIKFKAVSTTECGGSIELTHIDNSTGITSPNYPNAPRSYAECIWQVSVPNGEAVRVDFQERFDLQSSRECAVAGVEIRDGATAHSHLIGTYCQDMPGTIKTLQNRIYIRYYTNSPDPRNGFKAQVSIAFCGGTVRGVNGSITSPGYKHKQSYPLNVNCFWELWAPPGHSINLTIDDFDLPAYAQLNIVDVDVLNKTDTKINKFQITKPNEVLQFAGNKVMIEFSSGKFGLYEGFKLSFEASAENCGGELNTPAGSLTSPNYPGPNRGKQTCEWIITVPKGRRVRFVFDDVDLSRSAGSGQGIACFSGDTFASNLLFLPDVDQYDKVVRSSDNIMKVYYWSHGEAQNRGFKASYTSDEPSVCASSLDEMASIIRRPVEAAYTCTWEPKPDMTATQTLAFTVRTSYKGTAPTTACSFSQSAVYVTQRQANSDGHNFYADVLLQFCGTTDEPVIVRTLLPYAKIAANQENNSTQFNFTINYNVHDCGSEITSPDGVIVSPQVASTDVVDCAWRLRGQEGEQYILTATDFHLDDCSSTYLLIYNGRSVKSPLVGKYCGNKQPTMIQSQRHFLWLEYHGGNGSRFNLTYNKRSQICGGIHHSQSSRLQTPLYPNNYENNVECLWELRAKNGYHIELKFTDRFQLEEADGCANDFVSIYEQETNEKLAKRYCGRIAPPVYTSSVNRLFVLFRTNAFVTGSGFSATWQWRCGGAFNATSEAKYIESPGYPEAYSNSLRCEYFISAPGKYIRISFEDFDLEKSTTCSYDRLITGSGSSLQTYRRSGVFCGDKIPNVLRFYSLANLTFITDRWVNKRGFKFSYQIDACGGNITEPTLLQETSVQSSKSSGLYYSPMRKCIWNIRAPSNKRIVINFQKVNITYNIYCFSQSVSALDDAGNTMAMLCGELSNDALPTIQSNSNNMTLKFQYYNFGKEASFDAFIDFVYGPQTGCGGFINLTYTPSKSIEFHPPGDNYDCIWHVQTGIDYTIKVEFDVQDKSTRCTRNQNNVYAQENKTCCIFYQMRDGNTSLADEIFSGCDLEGTNPISYTSSGSVAQLRIVGRSQALKVPKIIISRELSICGHLNLEITNQTQYIVSPNYPSTYPANIRCMWRIKTKYIMSIHLHFEQFSMNTNLENITDCGNIDRLEIVDRNNKAFHLNYDLVWQRRASKWELNKLDSLLGQHAFCSATDKGYEYVSTANHIQISFVSDSRLPKAGSGFKIAYKVADFNRNYTGLSGRIARTWQMNNNTAYIIVPVNYTIALFFASTYQYQSRCSMRWIDVFDGLKATTPVLKLCGGQQAHPVFSTGNELVIQQRSTLRYGAFTSEMTYVASDKGRGCGGELYMFKGTFTSPLYPNPPSGDLLCRWSVRVPMGLQVAFHLKWLDIKGDCENNYVKISDVNQPQASSQVYCSKDRPAVFIATSGALTVEYKTDSTNTGSGWKAAFMAITSDYDYEKFKTET